MNEVVPQEEEIFQRALEIGDPATRAAYLDATCVSDQGLRTAVEGMLATSVQADRFFEKHSLGLKLPESLPSESANCAEIDVGTSLGPYTLVQRLGEGGGGVVYQAEQRSPVRREVAIKIIKLGMDTRRVIARFEAEKQTLALMEHPNIARVLDAGATETGRPYFVMELVRGMKITEYCERTNIPLEDRLRLFQQVCHAVQHAHQKGVIHRDLKPSNILIAMQDDVPIPKVIDFGVAKATAITAIEATHFTVHGQLVGTPAYMSPEQIQGGQADIDTRSDIYSLGVVLYELLAGQPPFDNEELLVVGIDDMRARILREEPVSPSIRAKVCVDDQTEPASAAFAKRTHWAQLLRGDLDWIALKALEKDRDRRYQTARGLALEVGHYLANEPVAARPPSRIYRLQKLVSRNKMVFVALGITALALLGGLTTSLWLYAKARNAEQQQALLRAEAEEREKISKAAVYLLQGKLPEADAEVKKLNGIFTQPSVEATNVFRALADWSAAHGEWQAAAERLRALILVNRFDETDRTDNATRDLLAAAPALVEAGNYAAYGKIRDLAIERFAATSNPTAAEQLIKISLLLPAKNATLAKLKPPAAVVEASLQNHAPNTATSLEAWRYTALGLLEFRGGNYEQAMDRCAASQSNRTPSPSRNAICHAVQAMSLWHLKRNEEALSHLAEAEKLIEARFQRSLSNDESGFWAEWLSARILLREGLKLIGPSADNPDKAFGPPRE